LDLTQFYHAGPHIFYTPPLFSLAALFVQKLNKEASEKGQRVGDADGAAFTFS
jgi:hypothetical protein